MRKNIIVGLFCISLLSVKSLYAENDVPSWEAMSIHNEQPEWLKDAKLGIYFHWGPYSVPEYSNEWYPRRMYMRNDIVAKYHRETYGDDFQYHDFIPMFKGEYFDAADWAQLFVDAGAKFAGPVAEHHDGFAMWNSDVTPWNAKDMGPQKDILGLLFKELEKRDLKTIATFHHSRNLQRFNDNWKEELVQDKAQGSYFMTSHYPYFPECQHVFNPKSKTALLYGNVPEDEWLEDVWLAKLQEVIDNYQPDILWFDNWLDEIPDLYLRRFVSYYLDSAKKLNKEVVIVRKQEDLPLDVSIVDHEKSRMPHANKDLWMTDDTFSKGSWSYTKNLKLKSVDKIIYSLIDAVSKNGILLLNISPKADGTIPQNQRDGLLELGAWLKTNGEAIYSTRPWIVAAEGPTTSPEGGFEDAAKFLNLEYSTKDIRYTASKDGKYVYAITLGVPKDGEEITLSAFSNKRVKNVTTLSGEKLSWSKRNGKIKVKADSIDAQYAYILKIELR